MPPLAGEERVLTVFADIHYYFTAPTPKPALHRFDKGSYLYLYHNAAQQKTRIEIANNPGTPDQDAFNGTLDHAHLRHSTTFPTRCTLTVDGQAQPQGGLAFPPPPGSANPYDWQLPTHNPHGENAFQRLHTMDIYFWTQGDADQFLDAVEQYLARGQLETDRQPFPPPPETTATSTIVQQLENVAITDPAYQNGQTRNSQSEAVLSPAPIGIPPPPPPPASGPAQPPIQQTSSVSPPSTEQKRESTQFSPLPYNPAAPAAPEPIKHREKTPPPPDAADGTGLAAAIAADNGVPYQPPSQTPGYAPPPQQAQPAPYGLPGAYASPPPSAGLTRTGSFPPQAPVQTPSTVPSYSPHTSIQSPPGSTYPSAYQAPVNPANPTAHLYGAQQQQQQQPPSLYGTQVPAIAGYSNYSYDQSSNPSQHQHQHHHHHHHSHHQQYGSEYDIHNQMYRPTESEANSHLQDHAKLAVQNPGQRPRKLEDSAARVESSVNRFLKKLEKKL
ncbi:hypothetical protein BJX63DRAFT_215257 [Aspergillus granulosus]|uniref:RNA recognition motif-containing protein n=1 Tax=Aspergillus granulosus TaxID=176169 RepID=A0ABR4HDR6_9EURO